MIVGKCVLMVMLMGDYTMRALHQHGNHQRVEHDHRTISIDVVYVKCVALQLTARDL